MLFVSFVLCICVAVLFGVLWSYWCFSVPFPVMYYYLVGLIPLVDLIGLVGFVGPIWWVRSRIQN